MEHVFLSRSANDNNSSIDISTLKRFAGSVLYNKAVEKMIPVEFGLNNELEAVASSFVYTHVCVSCTQY